MDENNVNLDNNVNVVEISPIISGFIGGAAAVGVAALISFVRRRIKEKIDKGNIEIHHEK